MMIVPSVSIMKFKPLALRAQKTFFFVSKNQSGVSGSVFLLKGTWTEQTTARGLTAGIKPAAFWLHNSWD